MTTPLLRMEVDIPPSVALVFAAHKPMAEAVMGCWPPYTLPRSAAPDVWAGMDAPGALKQPGSVAIDNAEEPRNTARAVSRRSAVNLAELKCACLAACGRNRCNRRFKGLALRKYSRVQIILPENFTMRRDVASCLPVLLVAFVPLLVPAQAPREKTTTTTSTTMEADKKPMQATTSPVADSSTEGTVNVGVRKSPTRPSPDDHGRRQ